MYLQESTDPGNNVNKTFTVQLNKISLVLPNENIRAFDPVFSQYCPNPSTKEWKKQPYYKYDLCNNETYRTATLPYSNKSETQNQLSVTLSPIKDDVSSVEMRN